MTAHNEPDEVSGEDLEFERLLLNSLHTEPSPQDAVRLDALAAASPARMAKVEGWLRAWTLTGLMKPSAD